MDLSSSNIVEIHTNDQLHLERTDKEALMKQAALIKRGMAFHMTLKSAMELRVFDIIVKAGGAYLSASEVAGQVIDGPLRHPDAHVLLDGMMALLATFSLLKCKLVESNDGFNRTYGMAPLTEYFLVEEPGEGGKVALPYPIQLDKVMMDSWNQLTQSLREGGQPFKRAHGMSMFEYADTDPIFNATFNRAMSKNTEFMMKKVLDVYKGFQGPINTLVDVGGGTGANLNLVMSRCPNIMKGINYDLSHVVAVAPSYKGVEHIAGDMFDTVPNGDVIFMKWILHNWSDERCLRLLQNCWKALPSSGKLIIVDLILPSTPKNEIESQLAHLFDMTMRVQTPGGKERTEQEFKALATKSGFSGFQVCCCAGNSWVMEFHK